MKAPIEPNKVVVFTGAGISAESGIPTYRDSYGHSYLPQITLKLWLEDPEKVIRYFNERRRLLSSARPNEAHFAVAAIESQYQVVVLTQNVDDLHEQAGSSEVLHLHGSIHHLRSSAPEPETYKLGPGEQLQLGQVSKQGYPLRPDVVWFGEKPYRLDEARYHLKTAAKVLVVGTSLTVTPAASLLKHARFHAEKIIIAPELSKRPFGFQWLKGRASKLVPDISAKWLADK